MNTPAQSMSALDELVVATVAIADRAKKVIAAQAGMLEAAEAAKAKAEAERDVEKSLLEIEKADAIERAGTIKALKRRLRNRRTR